MNSIVAKILCIRDGHSDRSLVQAFDADGREYRIEVPSADVRDLVPDEGYLLVLSWSIHASPDSSEPTLRETDPPAVVFSMDPAPSAVDAEFMAMMQREPGITIDKYSDNKPVDLNWRPTAPRAATPDEQLASMLGMPRDSKPTT
jgi:hypothetical protein